MLRVEEATEQYGFFTLAPMRGADVNALQSVSKCTHRMGRLASTRAVMGTPETLFLDEKASVYLRCRPPPRHHRCIELLCNSREIALEHCWVFCCFSWCLVNCIQSLSNVFLSATINLAIQTNNNQYISFGLLSHTIIGINNYYAINSTHLIHTLFSVCTFV